MKKYEYVNLDINTWLGAGKEEYRQVIDEYAAKG